MRVLINLTEVLPNFSESCLNRSACQQKLEDSFTLSLTSEIALFILLALVVTSNSRIEVSLFDIVQKSRGVFFFVSTPHFLVLINF